ncbi:DUF5590 domain-containing protein [Psychrobacillus sp. NPDC096623]|uniref:cell wall elongation regulator TseB-like domain-containing protein n=1 Tax=Psychrobacillus sp. NPDC096623 TaxID=3364492 RepID=UPI00380EB63B
MVLKRWLLFIVIFAFSLTLVLSLLIYFQAKSPFSDAADQAQTYALEKKLLAHVEKTYVYNNNSTFLTVVGTTAKGEKKAYFLPEKQSDEKIMEVSLDEGISEQQAIDLAMKDIKDGKLLHAKLGVEEIGPVWEITYVNSQDNLNYVYLLFDNGEWWKRISNL